jgi:hypothetical protein
MANPKAFYSYMENENKLNKLSDEQAGRLYKSLFAYSRTGVKPDFSDDPLLDYAFEDFSMDIDRDRERYDETCKRRAEAGKKSAESRRTNADSVQQKEAKGTNVDFVEQKRTKGTNVNFVQQKGTNANKMNETEAEIEAEAEIEDNSSELSTRARAREGGRESEQDFENRAQGVLELFSVICKGFVKPDKLSSYRRRLIYQAETDGVDFSELFRKAQASEFLTSGSRCRYGIDWVLDPKNRAKILEGNYEKPKRSRGSMFSAEGASFDLSKYEKIGGAVS